MHMGTILNYLLVGLMALVGGGSTVCIIGYMIVILAGKIYRKIRFGTSLYE